MSELMDVVNENDKVLYQETRQKIHGTGLLHRGIHILIFNSGGKLLLPFRSPNKDKFPNTYDTSISEHCKAGESYDEAACRGIKEELKIINPKLKLLGIFKIDCGPTDKMISALYECLHDGKIEIDKDEITDIEPKTPQELKEVLDSKIEKFAPWTREILKWYFHQPSSIKPIK
jgi:isopentenyl-diphosphate delta-isomerase